MTHSNMLIVLVSMLYYAGLLVNLPFATFALQYANATGAPPGRGQSAGGQRQFR